MAPDRWSVAHITADLHRLGVRGGDLVMVHASLRAIGPVDGGADAVIDALEAAVGPGGSLLMNVGARDEWAWVNDRPEPDRSALLVDAVPFDCRVTPADPEVGILPEVFRVRPGTKVSDHPEGRFGASGPLAEALLTDVAWDDYYGPGSPLERFTQAGGRVLRLGADESTVTLLHFAEYLTPLSAKRRVRRHRLVSGPDGPEIRVVSCLDDDKGIVSHSGDDYFGVILGRYLSEGRASVGTVGRATSELIEATDFVAFGAAWMGENLAAR